MAENDLFVSEVSADLRQERLRNGWRRYRWLLLLLFVVMIGLVGFNEYRNSKTSSNGEAQYGAIENALAGGNDASALAQYPSELSQMEEARVLINAQKTDEAIAVYESIRDNADYSSTAREFAKLQIYALDPAQSGDLLGNPSGKFATEASLIEVNSLLENNETDEAIALLQSRLDAGLSQLEQDFTENLILALGGEIAPSGDAPAVDPISADPSAQDGGETQ